VTEDLPGLPAAPLQRWLQTAIPAIAADADWTSEIISGGLSNITYRLRVAERTYILRRPPLGHALPRAHDVAREYRILSALWPTAVPVPEPLTLCTDLDVIGAPFYLMPEVTGVVLRDEAATRALTADGRAGVAEALIGGLADLHAVDPDAVGLGDYGRRAGYSARQIQTWAAQWERSRTRDLPDMDTLFGALAERLPPDRESTIVHGDYRLDNTIMDLADRPRLAAVLDWELSTLGDPLADLGLTLTYWHDRGDEERARIPVAAGVTALDGFPTGAELAQRYAERTGRNVDGLAFYTTLGAMKLAVILEGVHARHLAGQTVGDGYETAGIAVPVLVARGLRTLLGGNP
jgi:aminoglycoside phosphotransferase (APT) family kinase protein